MYTCTYTQYVRSYMHLRTRGCYITDGTCLVYFFWITVPTAHHVCVSVELSPTDCSTFTCSRKIYYINSRLGNYIRGRHTHTPTYTRVHKYVYICICTCMTCTHALPHIHTRVDTHIYTHVLTHTETFTLIPTHTHSAYLHLRTRGCYITDAKCLVFFLWITWPTASGHLLALLNTVPPIVVLTPAVYMFTSTTKYIRDRYTHTHTHTHMQKYVCIHMCACVHTHLYAHLCVQYYTCISCSEVAISLIVSEPLFVYIQSTH